MIKIQNKIIERSQKVGSRKNFFKNEKVWRKRSRKKIKKYFRRKKHGQRT